MKMPVAKSYMNCKIVSEPFTKTKGGKEFVVVEYEDGYRRTVRWYTDAEWAALYPDLAKRLKGNVSYRNILGFGDAGYITVYYGETYPHLDWFKEQPACRYNKYFGWFTPSDEIVDEEIPEGVEVGKVYWDAVCNEFGAVDENKATAVMAELRYKDVDAGSYVGEIGERRDFTLRIKKAIAITGYYGMSTMHIMEDADGNTFVWTTAAKTLDVGETYNLKGTIKDHKEYKGVKQTILTRCALKKEK